MTTTATAAIDVTEYLPLARHVANTCGRKLPRHVSREDLYAAALTGLAKACRTWNPDRGVQFKTHAGHAMRWAVQDFVRESFPAGLRRSRRWRTLPKTVSLRPFHEPCPDLPKVSDATDELCAKALRCLRRRDRAYVTLCVLKGWRQEVVGRIFGLSPTRVSQIVSGALAEMRKHLDATGHLVAP
jgi:RNA polymerase sigma factor (sigma-70 family)